MPTSRVAGWSLSRTLMAQAFGSSWAPATRSAAFDTRIGGPVWLTGRASKGIARGLRSRGCQLIADPQSFLVTKANQLISGEVDRARRWGASLARAASASGAETPRG